MPLNITEKIKIRKERDQEGLSDAFVSLSGVIGGDEYNNLFSEKKVSQSVGAINAILKSLGIRKEIKYNGEKDLYELLNNTMQPKGIMYRGVRLEKDWYENAFGSYLAKLEDGRLVALIPGPHGYTYIDNVMTTPIRIDKTNASIITSDAICFYRPFPQSEMEVTDLIRFFFKSLHTADCVRLYAYAFFAAIAALLVPLANSYIYNEVIYLEKTNLLASVFFVLVSSYLIIFLINRIKVLFYGNMKIKVDAAVNSAVMMRLLSLPASFFKQFSSGVVAKWIFIIKDMTSTFFEFLFSTLLGLVMCIVFITQMITVSHIMAMVVLLFFVLELAFSAFCIHVFAGNTRKKYIAQANEEDFLHSMMAGIQKIRISGAENRAFANWAEKYKKSADILYRPPFVVEFYQPINVILNLSMLICVYYAARRANVSGADYMVFASSFAMFSASVSALLNDALKFANVPSTLEVVKPFFEEKPEVFENKKVVTKLSGGIQLRHIKFRYSPDAPLVINDLNLDIKEGSYVAIVGKSGCGKSTLIRLLLGMEKCQNGLIMYGNHNLENVDIRSVRRRIGIVMQNSQLFPGSIKYNIAINSPESTEEDIWQAAKMAGIDETIRKLPMGLETIITGNDGGLSGGQKQRIAIARAIISKPDIIVFDEATSALDNVSQKAVVDSLDQLKCTRIVVAHRLSTIRTCDRIIMLENGKIIEDGSYDELIRKDGAFAGLVKRQQIDNP